MGVANLARSHVLEEHGEAGIWRSSWVGLHALRADRPVWVLTLAVAAIWLIYTPTESVLLPTHFEEAGQPAAFGLVISALAGGAMVGAFGYGWIARRMSRHRMTTVFVMLTALSYLPLAFLPSAAVMLVPAFLLGLAWGPLEPLLNSVVQDRFPEDQHGRVYGVQLAMLYAAPPLGQLAGGLAAERYGVQPVLFAVAAGLLVMGVSVRLMPSLRGLDEAPRFRTPARG
jgi:MFS family permease